MKDNKDEKLEEIKEVPKEEEKKPSKAKRITLFILLQFGILASSLSGVCAKFASSYPFMSWPFIGIYALEILFLGVYAVIWQQVIKHMQLSIAYTSKAVSLIWALLFGALIFGEVITINKVIGVAIVIAGIIVVNLDLWKKS